ncbi:MAG: hypothetical protein P0S96_07645 [Simkaniaceae bacterium]|nr:hypothetical protein [Candidatus Sacchlamyda saccharinae]
MNAKKISGIICILIGVALLAYGFYGRSEMAAARQKISEAKAPEILPSNPITDPIQRDITEGAKQHYYAQVDEYETPVMLLFIGGGVFLVLGVILLALGRSKPKK